MFLRSVFSNLYLISTCLPAQTANSDVLAEDCPQQRDVYKEGKNSPTGEPYDLQNNGEHGANHDEPLEPLSRQNPSQESGGRQEESYRRRDPQDGRECVQ